MEFMWKTLCFNHVTRKMKSAIPNLKNPRQLTLFTPLTIFFFRLDCWKIVAWSREGAEATCLPAHPGHPFPCPLIELIFFIYIIEHPGPLSAFGSNSTIQPKEKCKLDPNYPLQGGGFMTWLSSEGRFQVF